MLLLVFSISFYGIFFLVSTSISWYCLYKAWKTNPGILSNNRDEINKVNMKLYCIFIFNFYNYFVFIYLFICKSILQFIEHNEFALEQFCTSCVVRKPLRSKHCSECDHCVSKFGM